MPQTPYTYPIMGDGDECPNLVDAELIIVTVKDEEHTLHFRGWNHEQDGRWVIKTYEPVGWTDHFALEQCRRAPNAQSAHIERLNETIRLLRLALADTPAAEAPDTIPYRDLRVEGE